MQHDTIGVDVSKDNLDAHRLADGASRRFANDKGGHKAFVKWFAGTPVKRVVFAPAGPYHGAVERTLGAAGVTYAKVNPRQARRFAEAVGALAKTDLRMRRCWRAWERYWSCKPDRREPKPCSNSSSSISPAKPWWRRCRRCQEPQKRSLPRRC